MAWVAKFKYISTVILGARNIKQLEENLKAMEVIPKLTPEIEAKINKILDNAPEARMNYMTFTPMANLRP